MMTAFSLLSKFKGLRGTAFDVFGRTHERREDRALIADYRACVDELLASLSADRLALAAEIARVPELVKGYGHVKSRNLAAARSKWEALMTEYRGQGRQKHAA